MALFGKKRIYLDYASAAPVCAEAQKAVRKAESLIGNPGGIHTEGVEAKKALDDARARVAKCFGIKARELVFTSGLTDSNNIAIIGHARALEDVRRTLQGTHWLVSAIEHASVLDCFAEIERVGGTVGFIQPDERGVILPEAVRAALRPDTVFVSVGWANNEIGTLQPLPDISRVIRAHEAEHKSTVLLHADAGQAPLYESTVVETLGVDLLSIGSNKLYGPHGIGALSVSDRARVARVMQGGPQERGLRPGTENVALASGFAAALEHVAALRAEERKRLSQLRDSLARSIISAIPGAVVNGDLRRALPHMLNISIPAIQSEYVTLSLDHAGIAVSTKSACREGEERRSHVVEAMLVGRDDAWRAENTLRISLGASTTVSDIKRTAETLAGIINKGASVGSASAR